MAQVKQYRWERPLVSRPMRLLAAAGAAEADRKLVADEATATAGEDGRTIGETRPLLLAATGGEPPDAAAVRKHAAADRGVGRASGVAIDSWRENLAEKVSGRSVCATRRKARQFRGFGAQGKGRMAIFQGY
jgi:hypothetical protein